MEGLLCESSFPPCQKQMQVHWHSLSTRWQGFTTMLSSLNKSTILALNWRWDIVLCIYLMWTNPSHFSISLTGQWAETHLDPQWTTYSLLLTIPLLIEIVVTVGGRVLGTWAFSWGRNGLSLRNYVNVAIIQYNNIQNTIYIFCSQREIFWVMRVNTITTSLKRQTQSSLYLWIHRRYDWITFLRVTP